MFNTMHTDNTIDYVYVLRCVPENMTTTHGFVWPTEGPVECPDWDPSPECGHGLHGWLWGEGDLHTAGSLWNNKTAKWLVVKVEARSVVSFGGKCKFPKGEVVFIGDRIEAANRICALGAPGAVHFATRVAGDYGTATADYKGTATAGDRGTATAGDYGKATAGYEGKATAGNCGTATAGVAGKAIAGDYGMATAGDYGMATAGDYGTATAGHCGKAIAGRKGMATAGRKGMATAGRNGTATTGDYGTATAGDCGMATTGDYGTATAGDRGTATAGECGTIMIKWYNYQKDRYYTVVGHVGEDGIEANTPYVVQDGKLVKKTVE